MAENTLGRRIVVYKITCLRNGKCYIGVTSTTARKRWTGHCSDAIRPGRGKTALQLAIAAHGKESFGIEVICEVATADEAYAMERALIAEHGTLRPGGYNLTIGGDGTIGAKRSAEAVENNRQARVGKKLSAAHKAAISASLEGKPKSAAHIATTTAASTGRKHTSEALAKIRTARVAQLADPEASSRNLTALRASGPRISAAKKLAWSDPVFRAKMELVLDGAPWLQTEAVRKKIGEAQSALWADPEYRVRMKAARDASPKVRAVRIAMAEMNRTRGKIVPKDKPQ